MPAQNRNKEINLLPKEPWEKGLLGKLIPWILSVGRYVIVFTELVVISGFLYRFGLDKRLADINEKIKQNLKVIQSYGNFEAKFRQAQQQLNQVKTIQEKSLKPEQLLKAISQMTPTEAVYENIAIDQEKIDLNGRVLSEAGLATLLARTQLSPEFSGVALENVSSSTDNNQTISFRMRLMIKQNKNEAKLP